MKFFPNGSFRSQMIKKIKVEQLRTDMYVSDFNAGWLRHPFMFNSMKIVSEEQLVRVRESGIQTLYIDTGRGLDVEGAPAVISPAAGQSDEKDAGQAVQQAMAAPIPPDAPAATPAAPRVSLREELGRARNTFNDATRIIRGIMDDMRFGRQLHIDAVRPVVERISASIARNSNALMVMQRLQHNDDYTFLHSVNVCCLMANLTGAADMSPQAMHDLAIGALLHDIGKMRVSMNVLKKPGRLSDNEFRIMKSHVVLGADQLRQLPNMPTLAFEPLEQHHERMDGSGYPKGLKGEEISIPGRMTAIVDVYEALTSDSYYRKGINPAQAMQRLFEWSSKEKLFDPALVQLFVRSMGVYPVGSLVALESGRLGVVIEQRETQLLTPVVRVIYDARHQHYLLPEDVDLSGGLGHGGADRITGYETPEKWKIDPSRFMPT